MHWFQQKHLQKMAFISTHKALNSSDSYYTGQGWSSSYVDYREYQQEDELIFQPLLKTTESHWTDQNERHVLLRFFFFFFFFFKREV